MLESRPFSHVLNQLRGGEAQAELSDELDRLCQACEESGKVGTLITPSESWEQQWLFAKTRDMEKQWPELALLYAIPNGATTGKREGARLKAEGLKSGVPDLCLPVARGGWHGLYVELKRQNGTARDLSPAQRRWLAALEQQGYLAIWKAGYEAALAAILEYLSL